MSNVETVQAMYEAFGRGDVQAIIEKLDDNVAWEVEGGSTDIPWLQAREGREGATAFFISLTDLEFHKFEVTNVVAAGNRVIGLCNIDATVRANGNRYAENDEVHLWTFNDEGRVTAFRHRVDTHAQWKAFHGNA